MLEEVAKYRQGGRLPDLAYVHDNKVCVGIVCLLIVRACVRAGMYVCACAYVCVCVCADVCVCACVCTWSVLAALVRLAAVSGSQPWYGQGRQWGLMLLLL